MIIKRKVGEQDRHFQLLSFNLKHKQMRKYFYLVLILLSFTKIIGQSAPKLEWNKIIESQKNLKGYSIVETSDHCLVIAATKNQSFGATLNLLKTDYEGNKINEKLFNYANPEKVKMIKTKNDDLLTTGIINNPNGDADLLLLKTNSNLSLKWKKQFDNQNDISTDVTLCSDGGCLLSGISASSVELDASVLVVRLSEEGNLIWKKQYGDLGTVCNAAIQTKNKNFILIGNFFSSNDDGGAYFWITKISSSGSVLWEKKFFQEIGEANDIIETKNGNFLIVGTTLGQGGRKGAVMKIDNSGNIIWKKQFGGVRSDEMKRIIKNDENSYLIAGSTKSKGMGDWDFWLVNITAEGELIWDINYGNEQNQRAYDVVKTFDGGLAMVGYTSFRKFKKSVWLVKLKYSTRQKATEYVNSKISIWQQKGKFEKLDDYKKRVNTNTRQQYIYKLTNEFFEQIGNPIFDKDLKNASLDYDTESEVFKVNLTYFNSIYIPVPIAEAPAFDEN